MADIRFKSFSSGSCGNCYFLGSFDEDGGCTAGVIIDAGVSPRRLKAELLREHLDFSCIDAILVTHDHMDHIRSLGSFCKHVCKPVWATSKLHRALSYHTMTRDWIGTCSRILQNEGWTELVPGRVRVHWFEVPHDATQTVGYAIQIDGFNFVIMTDIGHMTEEALRLASQADTVVIESNYDLEMLRNGPYPPELQDRICLGGGHMSNALCAEAVRKFNHKGLKAIFLCHLSEHNNTPELARKASTDALECFLPEERPRLVALPRQTPSPMFRL